MPSETSEVQSEILYEQIVPGFVAILDDAPALDENLKPMTSGGQLTMVPVGSTAVRDAIERYQPLARRIAAHGVPAGQQAFRDYASTLIAWQRLPYLDPGLPLELLPADWSGVTAGHLFAELNGHLHEPALRHAVSVIHA